MICAIWGGATPNRVSRFWRFYKAADGMPKGARAKLDAVGAAGLASWIEPGGATMVTALGTPVGAKGFSLPCNLLVDRHGRVRGRAFGSNVLSKVAMKDGRITAEGKEQLQHVRTGWSLPAADRFAVALSGGLLDQV